MLRISLSSTLSQAKHSVANNKALLLTAMSMLIMLLLLIIQALTSSTLIKMPWYIYTARLKSGQLLMTAGNSLAPPP